MCSCPSTTLTCTPNASAQHTFASGCAADGDCFVAEHYVGCCMVTATGLNVSEKNAFTPFESLVCGGTPACGCAVDRLTTDDATIISRAMSYAVHCSEGVCRSFVP